MYAVKNILFCAFRNSMLQFCFNFEKMKISKKNSPRCVSYLATMRVKFQQRKKTWTGREFSLVQMDINSFKENLLVSTIFLLISEQFSSWLPLWVIRGYQICFLLLSRCKHPASEKKFQFTKFQERKIWKNAFL